MDAFLKIQNTALKYQLYIWNLQSGVLCSLPPPLEKPANALHMSDLFFLPGGGVVGGHCRINSWNVWCQLSVV